MARLQITVIFEVETEDVSLTEHTNYTGHYMDAFIKAIYNEESLRELQYKGIKVELVPRLI